MSPRAGPDRLAMRSTKSARNMAFRVDVTARAGRDIRRIYLHIRADDSAQALAWFNGLETAIASLNRHPSRGAAIGEDKHLRHLLYGNKPHIYRIIFAIDQLSRVVSVLHIRHGARDALPPEGER